MLQLLLIVLQENDWILDVDKLLAPTSAEGYQPPPLPMLQRNGSFVDPHPSSWSEVQVAKSTMPMQANYVHTGAANEHARRRYGESLSLEHNLQSSQGHRLMSLASNFPQASQSFSECSWQFMPGEGNHNTQHHLQGQNAQPLPPMHTPASPFIPFNKGAPYGWRQ